MGSYKDKGKEHAFNLISRDVREGNIEKPLFFYGGETYLIDWAIELIISKIIHSGSKELDLSILEDGGSSIDVIKATCETFPMLSEKRLVILKDFKGLEEQFVSYLAGFPVTCQLIIVSGEVDKRTKLYKEACKYWKEYEFDRLGESDLKKFIEKRMKGAGKGIKTSLTSALIEQTGYFDKESEYNLYNLVNDIKKVIAFSKTEEIQLSDITGTISGNVETNVYNMIDAVSGNRKEEAFNLLHNILTSGENIYYILAVIIGQFETILDVKELREEGNGLADMQKVLGIHEFRVKKAMGFAEKFSRNNIVQTLQNLYEVDRNIKNGLIDGSLALEIIIARI